MSEYYALDCFTPDDWDDRAVFKRGPKPPGLNSWLTGKQIADIPLEPLIFELMETHNDRLMELNKAGALIISKKLLSALQAAGVDNIQAVPAIIKHGKTGFTTTDYVAVNIVGLVAAADMGKSEVVRSDEDQLIDVSFDSIAIDNDKTSGMLMFRLAENSGVIIVHRHVKEALIKDGFEMLTFIDPKDVVTL